VLKLHHETFLKDKEGRKEGRRAGRVKKKDGRAEGERTDGR
jgi:hypothetical protein